MIGAVDKVCEFCPRKCFKTIVSHESERPVPKKTAEKIWKRSVTVGSSYYRCPKCSHMSYLLGPVRPSLCSHCNQHNVPLQYRFKPRLFKVSRRSLNPHKRLSDLSRSEHNRQTKLAARYKLDWCCLEHGSSANQLALLLSNYNNKVTH